MKKRTLITSTIAVGAGTLLAIAEPLAASAHVEVTPNTAAAGTYADITFRVPTESASATTTKVEVDIPATTPFANVSYFAVPGWDTELVTETFPKNVMQTYSNGSIVKWTGTGENAERPSPVLYVNDAPVDDHNADAAIRPAAEHDADTTAAASSGDALARVLGIGGLVVGAVGVVLSVLTLRRRVTG